MLAAGLTCGIAAGALAGMMFFADSDSSQPTVVAPGPAPQHAFLVTPSSPAASPKPVEPLPKPVVSAQHSAPAVISPAPQTPAAPSLRPQGDTTGVVDIPIPDCAAAAAKARASTRTLMMRRSVRVSVCRGLWCGRDEPTMPAASEARYRSAQRAAVVADT